MVNCQRVFCFNQMPEMCTRCDNIPVIDSIYCLIKLFSLFGSLTFIIILRGSFEQLKRQIGRNMANSDASSSTTCTVRVLVSFYLAAPDDSSSARTSPIHKEKFNVPLSGDEHKDLFNFVRHLKTFTGLVAWTWRRQCNPPRRRGRGCSCKLPIKDSAHAYRTTDHAFLSCSFFILR